MSEKLTLVVTDRANGIETRYADAPAELLTHLRRVLGVSADVLRLRLIATLDPSAPPVYTIGALYRYES